MASGKKTQKNKQKKKAEVLIYYMPDHTHTLIRTWTKDPYLLYIVLQICVSIIVVMCAGLMFFFYYYYYTIMIFLLYVWSC